MSIAKFIIAFFCLAGLSACIDTEEYIVVNDDNSGVYNMQIDMGKFFEMASQMGAEDVSTSKIDKLDSTIYLKNLISTADNLTASEKELYKDAVIKIKLNKPGKEMKIVMTCPFKSISQLPEIKNNFYAVVNKLKALDKLSGKEAENTDAGADKGMVEKALTPGADYYKFLAEPGKIEYQVIDASALANLMTTDSSGMLLQQMTSMMGEMSYKTKITTTTGFKNYSGANASLSADKKTITFTNTFKDMTEHPEKFAYKIEY